MSGQQLTALERAEQHDRDGLAVASRDVSGQVWMANWRDLKLPYCSIYIIAPIDGWPCKIGISTSPVKRINGLQTSVWKQLEVKWCGYLASVHEARELEKRSHMALTSLAKWLHGEWFDLRPDKAAELVAFEAAIAGIEVTTKLPAGPALDYVERFFAERFHSDRARAKRAGVDEQRSIRHWTSLPDGSTNA